MKWMPPMLATLAREPFSRPDWIFEPKLDGIRCLGYRQGSKLDLYSRNQLHLNETFSGLVDALLQQRHKSFIVDGEVVALEGAISRFGALQRRGLKPTQIFYYVFDILQIDGKLVTTLPLSE